MNSEDRIKEVFSNEEFVKGLFETKSYEAAQKKLADEGVEFSIDELKKMVAILKKKESGELSDEELENVSGGLVLEAGGLLAIGVVAVVGTWAGAAAAVIGC